MREPKLGQIWRYEDGPYNFDIEVLMLGDGNTGTYGKIVHVTSTRDGNHNVGDLNNWTIIKVSRWKLVYNDAIDKLCSMLGIPA